MSEKSVRHFQSIKKAIIITRIWFLNYNRLVTIGYNIIIKLSNLIHLPNTSFLMLQKLLIKTYDQMGFQIQEKLKNK